MSCLIAGRASRFSCQAGGFCPSLAQGQVKFAMKLFQKIKMKELEWCTVRDDSFFFFFFGAGGGAQSRYFEGFLPSTYKITFKLKETWKSQLTTIEKYQKEKEKIIKDRGWLKMEKINMDYKR